MLILLHKGSYRRAAAAKIKLERSYFQLSGGMQGKILPLQSPMALAKGGALCVLVVCSRSHVPENSLPDGSRNGSGNEPGNGSENGSETGAAACSN